MDLSKETAPPDTVLSPASWPGQAGAEYDAGTPAASAGLLQRFSSNKAAVIGAVILAVFVLLAIFAPLLTSYDPTAQNLVESFQQPSWQHLLGTDNLGRDVFARIIYGGRYTLFIGIIAVSIATIFGVPIGLISGYFGGAAAIDREGTRLNS